MEAKKIAEILKERLPEAVRDFVETTFDPYIVIDPRRLRDVARVLRYEPAMDFDLLQLITGVDWKDRFEVVYHLTSLKHNHRIVFKAVLSHDDPHVGSLAELYPTANWHERETYDLMGIVFDGHPELRRIYLPDDWEGHPLRKDYVFPDEYHGVSNR